LVRAAGGAGGSSGVVVVAGGSVGVVWPGRVEGAGEAAACCSMGAVLVVVVAGAARNGNSKGTRSDGISDGDSEEVGRSSSGVSGGRSRRKKTNGAAPAANSPARRRNAVLERGGVVGAGLVRGPAPGWTWSLALASAPRGWGSVVWTAKEMD
jgi:hypothetical protein